MHKNFEEMAMANFGMEEHVQTMGLQAATVVVLEVIAIVIWWETAAADSEK